MHPRVRVNPFEIALWILGAVLCVGGVAGALWGSRVMSLGFSCSGADCPPPDYAVAQAVYMLAPPSVTAGLVAVVLSIALRAALIGSARRAAVAAESVAEPEGPRESDAAAGHAAARTSVPRRTSATETESETARVDAASFAPPQFRPRRGAVDHSAFKRPTAD